VAGGVLGLLLASAAPLVVPGADPVPPAVAAAQGADAPLPPAAQSDFAGLVDIGGRRLYLECRGTGSPTVVLEAGYRSPATVWSADLVQPERPRTMVLEGAAAVPGRS
jgi:hypothetical protein